MRTFAPEPTGIRRTASAGSARPGPRTAGTARFAYDFSRIAVHDGMPRRIQPKLEITAPADAYEQEADRVADRFSGGPNAHAELPLMQRRAEPMPDQLVEAPSSADGVLPRPGAPLEPALRREMEGRFGYDFSRVRVHDGAEAEESAHDANAEAYTAGHHVVFGAGRYSPGTHGGKRLLAHELTHVVQQSPGGNVVQRL